MSAPVAPIVSAPLVWAELICTDVRGSAAFYGSMLGWKPSVDPGQTDAVVYLDQARIAGPICGIRPRTPNDPRPEGWEGPVPDRWTVRLSPPRPPLAADPFGDQLLRPRAPGPRLGRWGAPNSLCFAELRTADVEGARRWLERRLDAIIDPFEPRSADEREAAVPGAPLPEGEGPGPDGPATLLVRSSVDPSRAVAALVDEPDPAAAGWLLCAQVASLETTLRLAEQAGLADAAERAVPAGCPGTAAVTVTDPGGGRLVLVEHGPQHGRR